jgi:hypothetical protein
LLLDVEEARAGPAMAGVSGRKDLGPWDEEETPSIPIQNGGPDPCDHHHIMLKNKKIHHYFLKPGVFARSTIRSAI